MSDKLYKMAKDATEKSYAPYSKFQVGAAILTDDGRYFSGCNIENASYPEGWCAETTAIGHMIMDGGGKIVEMAVYCPQMENITPCGGCRQRISEFSTTDTRIHLCDKNGIAETLSMGELLPKAFDF